VNHKISLALAMAALLGGCTSSGTDDCTAFATCSAGGGGGGTSGLAVIDRDNAVEILREAWFAATAAADTPAVVLATGIGDLSGGTAFLPKMALRSIVALDPITPTTYNCPVSGTFILSGDVTDINTVTTGDYFVYEASACDSGTGYVVNGTLEVDITSIVGDVSTGMYVHGQTLTFTDFMASTSTNDFTWVGDHSAIIDTSNSSFTSQDYGGNVLSIADQGGNASISGFVGSMTLGNVDPFLFEFSSAGRVNTSNTPGSVDYDTEELILIPQNDSPTDGIFRVTGVDSRARISATEGEDAVLIQVDANANDNYEVSVSTTWDEFLNGTATIVWVENGFD